MTKHFCDCCGEELSMDTKTAQLELAMHLITPATLQDYATLTAKGRWETISGRMVTLLFCITCYNQLGYVMMRHLRELREVANNTNPLPT